MIISQLLFLFVGVPRPQTTPVNQSKTYCHTFNSSDLRKKFAYRRPLKTKKGSVQFTNIRFQFSIVLSRHIEIYGEKLSVWEN